MEDNYQTQTSKSEYYAKKITKRILERDANKGGVFCELTGSQGSGKTSAMLSYCRSIMKQYPRERIFWASTFFTPLQFVRIGKGKFRMFVQYDSHVTFHDRNNGGQEINPPVVRFKTFDDLMRKTHGGEISAVFFKDRRYWLRFIHYLLTAGEWTTVMFDEMADIAPSNAYGKQWRRNQYLSEDLREIRKCMISVFYTTQSKSDVDSRIRSKVMIKIYLPGARTGVHDVVEQGAVYRLEIDAVNGNEAWVTEGGFFGKIRFKDIFHPIQDMIWDARIPEIDKYDELEQEEVKNEQTFYDMQNKEEDNQ